ncbi:MAG: patatin-like phospholipase family protein [Thermoanaerobaculia bacterium]
MGRAGDERNGRVGLALAGGGPEGAIYQIGALRALDEVLDGLDFNDLHAYVGVSAGSFLAANLANRLTTGQMCRAIVKQEPGEHPFSSNKFLRPAVLELVGRGASLPRLLWEAVSDYLLDPEDKSLFDSLTRLGRALPVGVFDSRPIRRYLEQIYSIKGRTDDFRKLDKQLFVVAVDLDSGEAVRFGEPGYDHVPISRAVQASASLPGLYPPVEIDGRHYVDGVLKKTLHGSAALDAGAELLICINPIVPVDTASAVQTGLMKRGKLINRGLPTVISQTFRTLIHSRLEVGLSRYEDLYNGAEVVLLEPRRDDYLMFFTNIFSFSSRRWVCEHAYQATRRELYERREELVPLFAKRGIDLRVDVLEEDRDLWAGVGLPGLSVSVPSVPARAEAPFRTVAPDSVLADLDEALDRLENHVLEIN